jgi:hypothetical protein
VSDFGFFLLHFRVETAIEALDFPNVNAFCLHMLQVEFVQILSPSSPYQIIDNVCDAAFWVFEQDPLVDLRGSEIR